MAYPDSAQADILPADLSAVFHADLTAQFLTPLNALVARVSDSGWTTATLTSSWVAFGGTTPTPAYRLKGGVVYLKGSMKSGVQTTAALTLPTGMRPLADEFYACYASGGFVEIAVFASTGAVAVGTYSSGATNAQVALDGVRFIAEQ